MVAVISLTSLRRQVWLLAVAFCRASCVTSTTTASSKSLPPTLPTSFTTTGTALSPNCPTRLAVPTSAPLPQATSTTTGFRTSTQRMHVALALPATSTTNFGSTPPTTATATSASVYKEPPATVLAWVPVLKYT